MVALKAPGKPLNVGLGKCFARTTANALFCIPVSMETVRLFFSGRPNSRATVYPKPNPNECSKQIELNSFILTAPEAIEFIACTQPQSMAMRIRRSLEPLEKSPHTLLVLWC